MRYQIHHNRYVFFSHRPVFFRNNKNFLFDNTEKKFSVCKNRLIFFYLLHQFSIFRLDLLSFPDLSALSDAYLRLPVPVHSESSKRSIIQSFAIWTVFDPLIILITSSILSSAISNPCKIWALFFRFIEVVFCPSRYDFFLMLKIIFQHIKKIHYFRFTVYQSQHNHAEGILKLCMLIKLVQYDNSDSRLFAVQCRYAFPHGWTGRSDL